MTLITLLVRSLPVYVSSRVCVYTCVYKHVRLWGLICHWCATSTGSDHRVCSSLLLLLSLLWVVGNVCELGKLILICSSAAATMQKMSEGKRWATKPPAGDTVVSVFFSHLVSLLPSLLALALSVTWRGEVTQSSLPLGLQIIQRKTKTTDILVPPSHTHTHTHTYTHT